MICHDIWVSWLLAILRIIFAKADLEKFLKSSDNYYIKKYLDKKLFSQVYINEAGAPAWGDNEFDINPYSILNGDFDIKKEV
jgi:hypothetical protein